MQIAKVRTGDFKYAMLMDGCAGVNAPVCRSYRECEVNTIALFSSVRIQNIRHDPTVRKCLMLLHFEVNVFQEKEYHLPSC